jgi:hypothetical protein
MRIVSALPRSVWRGVRRLVSLVHGWDDVQKTYGDNPNDLSDEQRITARSAGTSLANGGPG